MSKETVVQNLKINKLTQEQYDQLVAQDLVSDTELYLTPDDSYSKQEIDTKLSEKQSTISDLSTIRSNASAGKSASDAIAKYGNIVTHNDSEYVHKAQNENIPGVKTFTGGSGGNNVAIKAPNGVAIGGTTQTAYSQYATIRLVNDKVNTGSYYIDGNGSVLFRHKTGTATAEGTANDAMFTINPETGIKAGFSGTAGKGITDADLHDVLIDTIEYSKLTTTTKDVLGAINETNSIAKGAQLAVAFSSYQNAITNINSYAYDKYTVGQSIMIETLSVPDLWVSAKFETSEPYTYTTDDAVVSALKTDGHIRVGRYQLSALETGKVDIEGYVKFTDYATNDVAGVIKVSSANGLAINSSSGHLYGGTRTLSQYSTGGTNVIISKGTLENIKEDVVARAIQSETFGLDIDLIEGAEQWL